MLKIYNKTSNITFPNMKTYTPAELAEDEVYHILIDFTGVIDIDSDGVTSAFYRLANLANMYNVEEQANPEDTLKLVVEAMNKEPEPAPSYEPDPQLQALATLRVQTMDLTAYTSTHVTGFRDYWPEWQPDTQYKYQQPLRHKGKYYRVSKALTSQEIYPPDTAGESEYYPIDVADDGIIVYRACHGAYDQVKAGETRHYPTASDPVYRAKVDTAYDPVTVPANWELVE